MASPTAPNVKGTQPDGSGKASTPPPATPRASLVITDQSDRITSLQEVLRICEENNAHVDHLETRPSADKPTATDIFVQITATEEAAIEKALVSIRAQCKSVSLERSHDQSAVLRSQANRRGNGPAESKEPALTAREEMRNFPDVPWFATTLEELVSHQGKTLQCGEDLSADHPSFNDTCYRARRKIFADISDTYVLGQPIPRVEYGEEENATWGEVYRHLTSLYPTHACETYNRNFKLLVKHCGYSEHAIPQMEDVSNFLRTRTGFRLRPISGLVDFRDYLAGLAFRVFQATQYIRHSSSPQYTPEPDVCHELLGHVPLFCDPEFAQFSQEIGLASLGAPDEWIEKLGNLYWYTVEFGLCREKKDDTRVYGGALLSSFGELKHCLTDGANRLPLDPEKVAATPYPITRFQDVYFVADSFQDVRDKLAGWITQIPRPFSLRYNAYTSSVEVLHKKEHLHALVRDIETEVKILKDALSKL